MPNQIDAKFSHVRSVVQSDLRETSQDAAIAINDLAVEVTAEIERADRAAYVRGITRGREMQKHDEKVLREAHLAEKFRRKSIGLINRVKEDLQKRRQ